MNDFARRRISIELFPGVFLVLKQLEIDTGMSRTALIHKAINISKLIQDAVKNDCRVIIRNDKTDKEETLRLI